MQFILHSTRRTPDGASRLVQAMPAWLVKTRRAPSQHSRDARVYGHTTTVMHKLSTLPPPPPPSQPPPPHHLQPCANPGTNRTCGGNWHSAIFVVGVLDTFELPEAATTDAVDDDVVLFSDDGRQSGFGPRSVASFGGTGDDDTSVYVSLVMETDDFEAPTPSPSPLPPPPSS